MSDYYFCSQLAGILAAPLFYYDTEGNLLYKTCEDPREWGERMGYARERASLLFMEKKDYPVICTGENGCAGAVIYSRNRQRVLAAGPFYFDVQDGEEESLLQGRMLDRFVSGCLLLYRELTGREMPADELWGYNKGNYEKIRQIGRRLSEDLFERHENYGKHNPYEQELRELESIAGGDEEALRQSISETYEGSIGRLAKDPLRHYKNVAIGNITLASRAAIEGGLSVENSFSMADSMIRQVEEINDIPELEMFNRECKLMYTAVVKEEREGRKAAKEPDNPLVDKVKDYIFSHLHEKIQISDIAGELRVNPNYLSYVFSRNEKISIKKYILKEKIRRSRNLLKYSDYRLQEISFYLGFSSQSHFTRTFQDMTGMSPSEYRKKFGNREDWK